MDKLCYHYLPESPKDAIKLVLDETDYFQILATLDEWIPIAMSNQIGDYDDFPDRERLVVFCGDLIELVGVMCENDFFENRPALALCKDFRDKYPLLDIRREMFLLFNAVTSYEGPIPIDRKYIGYSYLYLLTIAEVTHFLGYK